MRSFFGNVILTLVIGLSGACDFNSHSSNNSDATFSVTQRLTGTIDVQPQPFRLQLNSGGKILLQQCGPIQISRPDGSVDELLALLEEHTEENVTLYDAATQSGEKVTIAASTADDSSFRVSLSSSNVIAASVGLCLESGELIYGLTERLRDSAVLVPELHGPLLEEFSPDAVSSLNRRGEIVEMFVRPTVSLYAPFYHSSRGYGLWV